VTPVGTLLDVTVAHFSNRPAMDFLGRGWTYAALGALVARATRGLQDLGVGKGTMVDERGARIGWLVVRRWAG